MSLDKKTSFKAADKFTLNWYKKIIDVSSLMNNLKLL